MKVKAVSEPRRFPLISRTMKVNKISSNSQHSIPWEREKAISWKRANSLPPRQHTLWIKKCQVSASAGEMGSSSSASEGVGGAPCIRVGTEPHLNLQVEEKAGEGLDTVHTYNSSFFYVQLRLEQHRCELPRSNYKQIFFNKILENV